MPRSQEANQAIREARKQQLLNAAVGVFARRGFVGARIGDVADAAGISQGLLYHYFSSKEELFTALVRQAAQGMTGLLQRALGLAVSSGERLRWLVEQELAGLGDDPHIFMVVLQAMMTDGVPDEARQVVEGLLLETGRLLRQLIAEGQATGDIVGEDAAETALLFGTWLQGVAVGIAMRPQAAALPRGESLVRLFVRSGG